MKLRLWLSAEKLPPPQNKKLFGKNKINAFAVVSKISDFGTVMGVRRHRLQMTDVVPKTSSPEWYVTTELEHQRGTQHRLSVDVFHTNTGKIPKETEEMSVHRGFPTLKDTQQLCSVIFDVETILDKKDYCIVEPIPGSSNGRVTARLEAMDGENDITKAVLRFQLRGFSLASVRRNFMEKPDYHFEMRRKHIGRTQESWCMVYRSETDPGHSNPTWETDDIPLGKLCQGDLDRQIQISIYDIDKVGYWSTLGSVETTVRALMEARCRIGNCETDNAYTIQKEGKQKLGQLIVVHADIVTPSEDVAVASGAFSTASSTRERTSSAHSSGAFSKGQQQQQQEEPMLVVAQAIASPPPPQQQRPIPAQLASVEVMRPPPTVPSRGQTLKSFVSYVRDGRCNVDLCVAVDFTTANGDFRSPGTPHYRGSGDGDWNNYEWLMSVVGEAISDYSHTQQYPIWGFGGDYGSTTYQLFQCGSKPKVNGIPGLLEAYATTFQTGITFGRSRQFKKVIEAAAHHAQSERRKSQGSSSSSYSLLLVLTPGGESDVLAAKDTIVSVEGAPLSILFVRVPAVGQPTRFDDQKLPVYLSNRNCRRPFTVCYDSRDAVSSRNKSPLKEMVLETLIQQLPAYFDQHGQ